MKSKVLDIRERKKKSDKFMLNNLNITSVISVALNMKNTKKNSNKFKKRSSKKNLKNKKVRLKNLKKKVKKNKCKSNMMY